MQRAVHSQGDHGAASGNNGVQSFDAEVEKLKAKCLREAEEAFAREVKKLGVAEKTEAESYITLLPVHRACRRCQMEVEVFLQMVELEVHLKAQNLHQD